VQGSVGVGPVKAVPLESEIVDRSTARRRLADAKTGYLATLTVELRPHIVPCCFALKANTLYSAVDAKPKRTPDLRRVQNLRANASCSLLVDHYDEDWTTLWWIRIDGSGRVVENMDEWSVARELLAGKYEQYRTTPPPGPVLAIEIERWRTWP